MSRYHTEFLCFAVLYCQYHNIVTNMLILVFILCAIIFCNLISFHSFSTSLSLDVDPGTILSIHQFEHPEVNLIFAALQDCQKTCDDVAIEKIILQTVKITNEYLSLLLPAKAFQLVDDILYFLDNQHTLMLKLLPIQFMAHMAVGNDNKVHIAVDVKRIPLLMSNW